MRNIIGAIAHKVVEFADRYRVSNYKRWIVGKDYRLGDKVYISHPKNISIGERTATLDEVLLRSCNYFDSQVETSLNSVTSKIQPVMLLIVGGIVGTLFIAVYAPLLSMMNGLGNVGY